VEAIADRLPVIFPVHPRTKKCLQTDGLWDDLQSASHLHLIEPLGYLMFLALLQNAKILVTDSGGAQKEAYLMGTPCVTVRENTEWVETLHNGWNVLAGFSSQKLLDAVTKVEAKGERPPVFGEGNASKKIVETLKRGER